MTNTLAKEQEQKAALEEQLTGLREKLTNQSQDLQVLRRDLTNQKAELQEQTEGREESQTLLHEKQGECTSLRLEIEQVSTIPISILLCKCSLPSFSIKVRKENKFMYVWSKKIIKIMIQTTINNH